MFYRVEDGSEGKYLTFGGESYVPTMILSEGTQTHGDMTLKNEQELYGWAAAKDYKHPSLLKRNFKMCICSARRKLPATSIPL
ncbi:MAG: hypothetical protein J6J12_03970 [Oscillospiraceae bacterium]|nr:hypothetical protein [Oscillospiraceae bacterium]